MTRVADSGGLSLNVSPTQTVVPAVQITTTTWRLAADTAFTTTLASDRRQAAVHLVARGGSLPAGLA